ncbi:MAG TPA: hypothetical protein VFM02_03540 [Candidatus Paceibacterota bacterium]|nr:hypothetical protein [Candidatus Paceibacterota bacterium]
MIDREVIHFIRTKTEEGWTREQIAKSLIKGGGWNRQDVDEHFAFFESGGQSLSEPKIVEVKRRSNKMLYVNLGIFVAYTALAIVFGSNEDATLSIFEHFAIIHLVMFVLYFFMQKVSEDIEAKKKRRFGVTKLTRSQSGTTVIFIVLFVLAFFAVLLSFWLHPLP